MGLYKAALRLVILVAPRCMVIDGGYYGSGAGGGVDSRDDGCSWC